MSRVHLLDLSQLVNVFERQLANGLIPARLVFGSSLLGPGGSQKQEGGLGRFELEREGSVGLDGQHNRNGNVVLVMGRLGVELLAEINGLDTLGSKHGSDGRLGLGGTGANDDFHNGVCSLDRFLGAMVVVMLRVE